MKNTRSSLRLGGVVDDCRGGPKVIGYNFWVFCQVANLEVNYTQGKIKYRIECTDSMNTSLMMREDEVFGEDGDPMHLEDAIRELCKNPPECEVEFCEKQPDGSTKCDGLDWKHFGLKGPKGVWECKGNNKLLTIREWLAPYQTSKEKGVFCKWDNSSQKKMQVWADWASSDPCIPLSCQPGMMQMGTFIVNGGKCSNVIEFQPSFQWINAFGALSSGGETKGPDSAGREQKEDKRLDCEKKQGQKRRHPRTNHSL
jgi:hypothetical protein